MQSVNHSYIHSYNDFNDDNININYNDLKRAEVTFSDLSLFIKHFPNYSFVSNEKLVGTYIVDTIICEDASSLAIYEKYKKLSLLDSIMHKISLDKKNSTPRCYEYEVFNTKKTLIKNTITLEVLEKLDDSFFEQISYIDERLSTLNKPQLELEKSFLAKSIEDVFKQKNIQKNSTYNDLVKCFNEICEEHELLQKAYLDSLDTNSIKFDYQKKTQEVNDKLQTILSDMQNKLIIPPIALIVALANIHDKPILIKSLTMFILFFFFVIVGYYAYNQYKILDNYILTIENWKKFYLKFLSKNFKKIETNFKNISDIASNIQNTIAITTGINFILYIIAWAFIF